MNYHIIGVVLDQQFSLMDGLKNFGKPGEKASVKDMTQLHYMKTFIPLYPQKLTRKDILKALSSLVFLVEKLDGAIKAITCADGIKQKRGDSYKNHDYDSPTCANNIFMITLAREAKEGRDVDIIWNLSYSTDT